MGSPWSYETSISVKEPREPTCEGIEGLGCVLDDFVKHNNLIVGVVGGELLDGRHERHGC